MAIELNLTSLKELLESKNVPPRFYCLNGLGSGECFGISAEGGWHTYFSEKGSKSSIERFSTEGDAIKNFLTRLQDLLNEYGIAIDLVSAFQQKD
jgi:hypothetical protein